jgi:hypothetical protein
MKHIYFVVMLSLILISCEKDGDSIPECNIQDPIEELDWLKEMKNSLTNCTCQVSIVQGTYRRKTVYYLIMNDPLCNSVFGVTILDCHGDEVKKYGVGDEMAFNREVDLVDFLYTCTDEK